MRRDCIEVYETRHEWLHARRGGASFGGPRIGASDIGKILGKSPHGGPWDVYLDKMGLGAPEPDNESMAQGRRWERRVLEDYAEATRAPVAAPWAWVNDVRLRRNVSDGAFSTDHILLRHPAHPWATCSPDGFSRTLGMDFEELWGGVECKAVMDPGSAAAWDEDRTGLIITPGWDGPWPAPLHYVLQVYWSMAVTGLPAWDLAAILMPRRGRLVYFTFLADPELQAALLAQVGAWRERHLVEGVEPAVDDSAAAWSYYAGLPHGAPLRPATEEEAALAAQLHRAQQAGKAAEAEEKRLKNELAALMHGVAGVALGPAVGRKKPPRAVWQHQRASSYVVNREETNFIRLWDIDEE